MSTFLFIYLSIGFIFVFIVDSITRFKGINTDITEKEYLIIAVIWPISVYIFLKSFFDNL